MNWFWMNMPFAALIFALMTLVPVWLVVTRPDRGPTAAGPAHRAGRHAAAPRQAARTASAGPSARPAAAPAGQGAWQLELADYQAPDKAPVPAGTQGPAGKKTEPQRAPR
jgi:hypothetical protein